MSCFRSIVVFWPAVFLCFSVTALASEEEVFGRQREALVRSIQGELELAAQRIVRRPLGRCVIDAMLSVPRHKFVPEPLRSSAYENRPLPIGHGQTISQPFIVGIMTDLLDVNESSRVLEVGTGSGYQAAILARCVKEVYTVEIIEALGREAAERLQRLGYGNVHTAVADGYYGWKEHAPFDAIMVTAAADHIPPPLIEQLKPGGKMVIPVGGPFLTQYLMVVEKGEDSAVRTRQVLPVAFVPLTGGH